MLRYSLSLLLPICLAAAPLAAQDPARQGSETGPGRVTGVAVNETGAPMAAAAVSLLAAGDTAGTAPVAQAITSEQGRFRLDGIPLGRYRLRITYIGYAPLTTDEIVLTAAAPRRTWARSGSRRRPVASSGAAAATRGGSHRDAE